MKQYDVYIYGGEETSLRETKTIEWGGSKEGLLSHIDKLLGNDYLDVIINLSGDCVWAKTDQRWFDYKDACEYEDALKKTK